MDGDGRSMPGSNIHPGARTATRVLLVEDHDDTRRVTGRLLRLLGCCVAEARDMAEARRALAGGRFDLLVCDIRLPDGDGRTVMREAKNHGLIAGIAVSGEAGPSAVEQSIDAGFAAHLVKPIIWSELESAVRRATAGHLPPSPASSSVHSPPPSSSSDFTQRLE